MPRIHDLSLALRPTSMERRELVLRSRPHDEALCWLLDAGVRAIGCDAESLEGPVAPMLEALRAGRPEQFFPLHYAGRDRPFCFIEKMDLSGLTRPTGFKVAAFPIKLERCGAAWTRAVAFVEVE